MRAATLGAGESLGKRLQQGERARLTGTSIPLARVPVRLARFVKRVVVAFYGNHGLLLASGVGYNLLLSVIPLLASMVVGLSLFFDEQRLLATIAGELELLVPRHADELTSTVQGAFESRDLFGVVGFGALLFFSSVAFRMLEDAIMVIFHKPPRRRGFWASFLISYAYVGVLAVALVLIMAVRALFEAVDPGDIHVLGWKLSLAWMSGLSLYVLTLVGEVLLFTSLYKVLPHVEIRWRSALSGALVAAGLWEIVSLLLAYYFTYISLANVVYGSLATVIVVLLIMEIGAAIVLLGVQIMAELERSRKAGVAWYQEPPPEEK